MRPKISLVVVTLEEPEETARTVESALAGCDDLEVIVVDDHSRRPPAIDDPRVRMVVQPKRCGLGVNKNLGAELAVGQTIIFSDAHMRFPEGLLDSLHRQSQELGAVVFPKCRPYPPSRGEYWGAKLVFSKTTGVDNRWRSQQDIAACPRDRTHEVSSMLGACYAFPRHVWEELGGEWWNTSGVWGFLEQHMTLRCWFQGIKIYLDPTQHVFHQFWRDPRGSRREHGGAVRPYLIPGDPKLRNAIATLRSIFSDEVWERELRPLFEHLGDLQEIIESPDVVRRKRWFASKKIVSEAEVLDRIERDGSSRPGATDVDAAKVGSLVPRRGGDTDFESLLVRVIHYLGPSRILEWGPGFSTDVFVHLCPSAHLLSIEHDARWFDKQKRRFREHGVRLVHLPLGPASRYATHPLSRGPFDLIFIDGRRRNECMMVASRILKDAGLLVLHDANRPSYEIGRQLFSVVADEGRTAVLCNDNERARALHEGFQAERQRGRLAAGRSVWASVKRSLTRDPEPRR